MSPNTSSTKIARLAVALQDKCQERGVTLVGDASKDVITRAIRSTATMLGITDRTVIDRYMSDDHLDLIADHVAEANQPHMDALATAEPIYVAPRNLGGVIAALGLILKSSVDAAAGDSPLGHPLDLVTDAADAITGIGAAIATTPPDQDVHVPGDAAMHARRVLNRAFVAFIDGIWPCPCRGDHVMEQRCAVQSGLIRDLLTVGGAPSLR